MAGDRICWVHVLYFPEIIYDLFYILTIIFFHENKQTLVLLLEHVLFRVENPPSKKIASHNDRWNNRKHNSYSYLKAWCGASFIVSYFCVPCRFCRCGKFMTAPKSIFLSRKYMYTSFGMHHRKPVKPLEGHLARNESCVASIFWLSCSKCWVVSSQILSGLLQNKIK